VRLKASWEADYKAWCQRDLSTKRYVYWWADGIYFNVRLDEERSCVLVLIAASEGEPRNCWPLSMVIAKARNPGANCSMSSTR
jgi:hypothetical protein